MGGGAHLPLSHTYTPAQIFQNVLFRCSLAQAILFAIFALSSVSLIDCTSVGSCSDGPASWCSSGRLRAENVRSEVADVTGIVKNIGKSVFRHQNVWGGSAPQFLFLANPCPSLSSEATDDRKQPSLSRD